MSCEPLALIATLLVSAGDGDNLVGHVNGVRENMRLCGINAPEIHGGVEPGGREAAAALDELVSGRKLRIYATPQGRDRYGRLVIVAVLPDGREVSCAMIAAGHAEEEVRYSRRRYAGCERSP